MIAPTKLKQSNAFIVIATLYGCLVVTLVALAAISTTRQPNPKRPTEAAAQDQQTTKPIPSTIQSENRSIKSDTGSKQEAPKENGDLSQTIAAWVQAFAAVVSLALTIWLIWYSHRGWEAAEKNAAAAQKSADIAEEALRITQRARVAFESFKCETIEGTPNLGVTVFYRNFGATHATVVESNFTCFTGNGAPEQPPYHGEPRRQHVVVSPRGIMQQFHTIELSTEDRADLEAGKSAVYVVGYWKYRDVFKDTPLHQTSYGALYILPPKVYRFIERPGYNDAD